MGYIWAFFFVPETKGRTLEQLDEMFINVSTDRRINRDGCIADCFQQKLSIREFNRFVFPIEKINGVVSSQTDSSNSGEKEGVMVDVEKVSP